MRRQLGAFFMHRLKVVGILYGFFAVLRRARIAAVHVIRGTHRPLLCPFLHPYSLDLALAFAPFAVLLEQHLPLEVFLEFCACLDAEEVSLLFFMIFLLICCQKVSVSLRSPGSPCTAGRCATPRSTWRGSRTRCIPKASACPACRAFRPKRLRKDN